MWRPRAWPAAPTPPTSREWLLSWIIGVEWDPAGRRCRPTRRRPTAPYRPGTILRRDRRRHARPSAGSPRHMDDARRARGRARHLGAGGDGQLADRRPADAPRRAAATREDLVGVDANHVLPTDAWPGGTFASFHAYPYYPDFQRYEPGLQDEDVERPQGPVRRLRRRRCATTSPRTMPLLVTEFGVPSSLGSAHDGAAGRDQGAHTEQEAMAMNADMMRMLEAKGARRRVRLHLEDEWFKRTWNTMEHQDARAPPALARPADQRAVVRPGRHRPGPGRRRGRREDAGDRRLRVRLRRGPTRRGSTST